jgi:hypothetical protein
VFLVKDNTRRGLTVAFMALLAAIFVSVVLAFDTPLRAQVLLGGSNVLQALGGSSSSEAEEEETSGTEEGVLLGGDAPFIYEEFMQELEVGR